MHLLGVASRALLQPTATNVLALAKELFHVNFILGHPTLGPPPPHCNKHERNHRSSEEVENGPPDASVETLLQASRMLYTVSESVLTTFDDRTAAPPVQVLLRVSLL
jgi:hypothetical protein